jgi:hypothetical protein
MISGLDRRRVLLALLALGVAPARAEPDLTWTVPELMARLRSVRSGSARFVEQRFLQIASVPLQSSGVLRYTAPDRLEKQTLAPQPGRLLIEGDRLTVERAGETTRSLSLRDVPEIGALVDGLRATMAGDLATLNRLYTLSLQGTASAWQLNLVPRDPRMRKLVAEIRIAGRFEALLRIDTLEADGDRTEMTIVADPP